jgi:hypothetical protein
MEAGILMIKWIAGTTNGADIFTKNLMQANYTLYPTIVLLACPTKRSDARRVIGPDYEVRL